MLSHLEKFAVSKIVPESQVKKFKGSLPSGEHDIDLIIRIFGKMTVTHGDKDSTCSIPWLKALAIALHKSGIQQDNILTAVEEAVKISIALGQDEIEEMIGMEMGTLDTLVKKIKNEVVAGLPKTPTVYSKAKLVTEKLELEDGGEQDMMIVKVA